MKRIWIGVALLAACAFGALVSIAAVVRLVRRAAPLPPG